MLTEKEREGIHQLCDRSRSSDFVPYKEVLLKRLQKMSAEETEILKDTIAMAELHAYLSLLETRKVYAHRNETNENVFKYVLYEEEIKAGFLSQINCIADGFNLD